MTTVDLSGGRLGDRSDDVYAALIAAHDALSDADSAALNARLILLLANLVGDPEAVIAAIAAARRAGAASHSAAAGGAASTADPPHGARI